MNMRRLSYGLVVTLSLVAVACGDATPPAENPPVPPPPSSEPVAAAPTAEPASTAAAVDTGKPAEPPPPPAKPLKEKFAGKWVQDFAGDAKAAADEAAKKAGGPKADQKKIDAAMKKAQDAFAKTAVTIENADGNETWTVGGKAKHKFKYDVSKEDGQAITIKANGKDEVSKKDMKEDMTYTFSDDNTLSIKNPDPAAKGAVLVFKRQ